MYQAGGTIKALVGKQEYLIPAIRRKLVWQPSQICRLFNGLLQSFIHVLNKLPNLQLAGTINNQKRHEIPHKWYSLQWPDAQTTNKRNKESE
jgi:hypothetical protein